jgi:hypothetical protein
MKKKSIVITVIVLVAIIALMAAAFLIWGPKPVSGNKTIQVEIVKSESDTKTVEIKTDAEFLRQALEQENLVQGDESEYGLFITSVDGRAADSTKQEWWCITKNNEQVNTGVDSTPIQDGDKFEITLTVGF